MSTRLAKKTAIITGAGRGIGRAIALRFAQEGANVVINDIDASTGEQTAAAITANGGKALFVEGNAASEADLATLMQSAATQFETIDILVNNATPGMGAIGANRWEPILEVGLKSYWLAMQAALPWMKRSGSGSIVNISSVNGLMGFGNEHVYSGVKAAILGMSRSMVGEHAGAGIRINCICPGTIVTENWQPMFDADPTLLERLTRLYPTGRVGRVEDIANAALFLASEEAAFVNGSVLVVDGGLTAANTGFIK